MEEILQKAIAAVQQSEISFSKYITANDTGSTGAHQSGFHIHKKSWQLFFESEGQKGFNKDHFVNILWQNDFTTLSRAIYYGNRTRNEYRLTRFGRNFPFLQDENIGDLLILCKQTDNNYEGFVLQNDEDIDNFLTELNLSSLDINGIIPRQFEHAAEDKLLKCFTTFLQELKVDFPPTIDLANRARHCYNSSYNISQKIIKINPDKQLLNWLFSEFELFKTIENDRYLKRIKSPFLSVEELVQTANTILNRRKSRAGKSLEHHLAEIFNTFDLQFETQSKTEDNKKPDFLFPGMAAYNNINFEADKIITLASKTTCKDRWRQILNEADRVKTKHLFTLQQGISSNQLEEMYKYNVCLVVPKDYVKSFPKKFIPQILTLGDFVKNVQLKQH